MTALEMMLWGVPVLAGFVATWWFGRLYGTRRIRLVPSWKVTPLLSTDAPSFGSVKVLYDDLPIANPHLLELTITNESRQDVGQDNFDGGLVRFTFQNAAFKVVTAFSRDDASPELKADVVLGEDDEVRHAFDVVFPPHLLQGGEASSVSILCEGAPELEGFDLRLKNVSVGFKQQYRWRYNYALLGFSVLAFAFLSLIPFTWSDDYVAFVGAVIAATVVVSVWVIIEARWLGERRAGREDARGVLKRQRSGSRKR